MCHSLSTGLDLFLHADDPTRYLPVNRMHICPILIEEIAVFQNTGQAILLRHRFRQKATLPIRYPQQQFHRFSHLCTLPQPGYLEQQFFHEMGADADGNTICALINDELELAVYLKYNVRELPCIAQWKVLRDAEYVLAFEPGNCHPIGRTAQKQKGLEEYLAPMQSRFSHLEIGVCDGPEEIAALENEIAKRR